MALWAVTVLLVSSAQVLARPRLTDPALAIVHQDPEDNPDSAVYLSITGSGLGRATARGPACAGGHRGASLELIGPDGSIDEAASGDASIISWMRKRVVARLSSAPAGSRVRLCTSSGRSNDVAIDTYEYRHFDVPRSPGTNASPLAVTLDAAGRVWVNEEFNLQLKTFDPMSGLFSVGDIPENPTALPFATRFQGEDSPSRISDAGEDITVDPRGRVWLTQGGGSPQIDMENHSRVVSFDPTAPVDQQFRIYNVPGNDNRIVGVAWDERRGRIWFTEAVRSTGGMSPVVAYRARLVSFDPERIAPDNQFDFATTATCRTAPLPGSPGVCSNVPTRACLDAHDCVLADQICPASVGPADDASCYREYELPSSIDTALPAHIAIHPDGSVWFTGYFGSNSVGRLDPESASFRRYLLPDPKHKKDCDYSSCSPICDPQDTGCTPCSQQCSFYAVLGSAPWDIAVDQGANVVFTEYNNNALGWIPVARQSDPRCGRLDRRGPHRCVRQYFVPGADFTNENLHSLAVDAEDNVWFTQGQGQDDARGGASVGYLKRDRRGMVVFPPLSLYPMANSDGSLCGSSVPIGGLVQFTGGGIAVDRSDGSVWFTDYCRKRLGHLRKL